MRAKRWAGLAAVGAAGTLLVGCGSPAPVVIGPVSPTAQAFFDSYESVRVRLGSDSDAAAEAVQRRAQAQQHALSVCMAARQFSYQPVTVALVVQERAYEPSWWAAPDPAVVALGMGYAGLLHDDPPTVGEAPAAMNDQQKAAYNAVRDACSTAVSSRFQGIPNPQAQDLLDGLNDTLFLAAGEPPFDTVADRYAACMSEAGVDVSTPGELYDLAEERASKIEGSLNPTSQEYADRLGDAVRAQAELGAADASCRAKDATRIAALLEPVLDEWLAEHHEEVDAAAAAWATVYRDLPDVDPGEQMWIPDPSTRY